MRKIQQSKARFFDKSNYYSMCKHPNMKKQNKKPYRTPDNVANAAEELKKITGGKYRKLAGSRAIAPYLKLDGSNLSHSFRVLCSGIRSQATQLPDSICSPH